MRFQLPKPLHGWPEFIHEVIIVVIGVLLALAGGQLAEKAHWRSEVSKFRTALTSEIDFDIAAYQYRLKQGPCIERRLAELERWSAAQHSGQAEPLVGEIAYPSRIAFNTSVWNSRSAELTAHLPERARLTYSDLYDQLANQWNFLQSERDTWLRLNGFNHSAKLGPEALIELDELIYRARMLNRVLIADVKWFKPAEASLGVRPSFGSFAENVGEPNPSLCKPIRPPSPGAPG
jgi:hypothetical protein